MPKRLTAKQIEDMLDHEIERHVFKGAGMSEHRSLRDGLTDEAIIEMVGQNWRGNLLRDWGWSCIDAMYEEGVV